MKKLVLILSALCLLNFTFPVQKVEANARTLGIIGTALGGTALGLAGLNTWALYRRGGGFGRGSGGGYPSYYPSYGSGNYYSSYYPSSSYGYGGNSYYPSYGYGYGGGYNYYPSYGYSYPIANNSYALTTAYASYYGGGGYGYGGGYNHQPMYYGSGGGYGVWY